MRGWALLASASSPNQQTDPSSTTLCSRLQGRTWECGGGIRRGQPGTPSVGPLEPLSQPLDLAGLGPQSPHLSVCIPAVGPTILSLSLILTDREKC